MANIKIGEVAKIFNGYAFKSNEYSNEGYQVIRITNVQNGYISNSDPKFISLKDHILDKFILNDGDILISLTGNVGRVGKITKINLPAVLNQRVGKIIVKSDKILPDYLFRILSSKKIEDKVIEKSKGIAQKNIGSLDIENIEIPLPSIQEQRSIIKKLEQADLLVQKRKKAILLLDTFLDSVYAEMFGDPIRNEKDWGLESLSEVAKLERGRFSPRPRNDPTYFDGNYPFIQTGDISNSSHRLKKFKQTLNDKGIKVSKHFNKGNIVIAIVGATIGVTAILEIDVYATDSVICIQPKDTINNIFLEYTLRYWREPLLKNAPEVARPNINLEILKRLKIICPSMVLQTKFAQIIEKTEVLKQKMLIQSKEMDTQYQALMQKSFQVTL